jgi:hypothetical protein
MIYGNPLALVRFLTNSNQYIKWVIKRYFRKSKLIKALNPSMEKQFWMECSRALSIKPSSSIEELFQVPRTIKCSYNSVLADQQKIERELRYHYTTPLPQPYTRDVLRV